MPKLSRIILYDEPAYPHIRADDLARFAERTLGVASEVRPPILDGASHDTLRDVASARVRDHRIPFRRYSPSPEEVLQERSPPRNIVLYDGFELQGVFSGLVPPDELRLDTLSVVFTTRLACTYDCDDLRYHGRAVIAANPGIISTTGVLEAPAKPREYYVEMMQMARMGLNEGVLREKYSGTYLEYDDPRMPRVIQGYLLQAAFYHMTGMPFCGDPSCRLFNSHWQADLIRSQIESGRLCGYHRGVLGARSQGGAHAGRGPAGAR